MGLALALLIAVVSCSTPTKAKPQVSHAKHAYEHKVVHTYVGKTWCVVQHPDGSKKRERCADFK